MSSQAPAVVIQALTEEGEKFKSVTRVVDEETLRSAAGDLVLVKQFQKRVNDFCNPNIAKWHEGHKAATKMKNDLLAAANAAEISLKEGIKAYEIKKANERREELARAEAAAKAEEERKLALAAELEAEGKADAAAIVMESAMNPEVVPVLVKATKVAGVSTSFTWKGRIVDRAAFLHAVADGKLPPKLVEINEGELNRAGHAIANSQQWPGVQWYEDAIVSGRSS